MKKKQNKRSEIISIKDGDPTIIIPAMQSLKRSNGWKLLSEVLQQNIAKIERTILESDDRWDQTELMKWRDMRFFEKQLLTLPDTIIAAYKQDTTKGTSLELDPYKKVDNS